jgi:hypothetical protein
MLLGYVGSVGVSELRLPYVWFDRLLEINLFVSFLRRAGACDRSVLLLFVLGAFRPMCSSLSLSMLCISPDALSLPPLPFSLRAFDLDLQGLDLGLKMYLR